jgi:hypothetical protein
MKTGFPILYLIFCSMLAAQSVHLTVPAVDSSSNAVAIGMAYFTWGQFTGNDGVTVQAGQSTRPITNGTIDVTLTASDNAGYVYNLLIMNGSNASTFQWRVPAAGATSMAQLNQPPLNVGGLTVVRTDQPNTYTAGMKQTFAASPATAGEGFSGTSSDPTTLAVGDLWFRTDLHHLRIYDGTTGQTVMYQSDTLPWNQLGNPTAATSLLFAANPFNITFGSATGSGNMMTVIDTAGNTGTGYVFRAGTASGSSAKPFQVLSKSNSVIDVDSAGALRFNNGIQHVAYIILNSTAFNEGGAFGDIGNAVQVVDSDGTTLRQLKASSIWIGATTGGSQIAGFATSGSATVTGLRTATATKAAGYTASSDDLSLPCDATSGAVTIALPSAPKTGEWKALKKLDSSANTCTYSGNGKNIEGGATLVYSSQYQHAMAQYDGTQWWLY